MIRDRRRRHPRAFAVTLAILAGVAACTGTDGGDTGERPDLETGAASVSTVPGTTGADTAEPEILRFDAPRLGGGQIHGTNYAGKDLAIWFWAPW
jgi:hypothetical protein